MHPTRLEIATFFAECKRNCSHRSRRFGNVISQNIHISTSNRKLKAICAIIATISIAAFGFLLLPSIWFWIGWEILGAVLVAIGCVGEWYLITNPPMSG